MKKLILVLLATIIQATAYSASQNHNETKSVNSDLRARVVDMANRGKKLYVEVIRANTEREAAGLLTVLPLSGKNLSNDKEDISGILFMDTRQYFKRLFDLPQPKAPYLACDANLALINGNRDVLWNVMVDYDAEKISDQAPLFVSANFDCSRFPVRWPVATLDADKVIPIGYSPIIGGDGIVIVTKGGKVIALPAEKVTLRNIYGDGRLKLPRQYLTPTGIVTVGK